MACRRKAEPATLRTFEVACEVALNDRLANRLPVTAVDPLQSFEFRPLQAGSTRRQRCRLLRRPLVEVELPEVEAAVIDSHRDIMVPAIETCGYQSDLDQLPAEVSLIIGSGSSVEPRAGNS